MNNHKRNTHNNVTSLTPFQKSPTAFLMEELDKLDTMDKPYHVEVWDFSPSHTVGVYYQLILRFTATKSEYVAGIQDALYKFYHDSKKKNLSPLSVNMMDGMKTALQHIADCLESTKWHNLEKNREWRQFLRQLKQRNLGKISVEKVLSALNKLTECNELGLYVDAKAIRKCARSNESKQHVAFPHRLYQRIISHALETVEKYHSYRHEISAVMGEAYEINTRLKSGEKIFTKGRGSGRELSMTPIPNQLEDAGLRT